MPILITALDPANIWFSFILLQVVLVFISKRHNLNNLLIPYEIVLNSSALLYLLDSIPSVIFFTVTCTVASLASTLYLYVYIECKLFKKF